MISVIADVDVFETCAAAGEGPSVIITHYEAAFLTVAKIISHVGKIKTLRHTLALSA